MTIRQKSAISLLLLSFVFSSCASKTETVWEKRKGTIIVHHFRKTGKKVIDVHPEKLTSEAVLPAEYHVYDLGRMPDNHGGMVEATKYYRVSQDESVNTMLPKITKATRGVVKAVQSPTYSPMPESQRINDAVTEANEAKNKLDDANAKANSELGEVNGLRDQLQETLDKLKQAFVEPATGQPLPQAEPAPQSEASKAGEQAADGLAQWGKQLKK